VKRKVSTNLQRSRARRMYNEIRKKPIDLPMVDKALCRYLRHRPLTLFVFFTKPGSSHPLYFSYPAARRDAFLGRPLFFFDRDSGTEEEGAARLVFGVARREFEVFGEVTSVENLVLLLSW